MSFRKIRVYKKRVHSITATEILDRLDRYVNQNDAEPIRLLVTHWKDQQDALSYREIREAILNGDFDGSLAKEWTDDYSRFVAEKMVPVWKSAMVAGSFGQPIADKLSGKFRFDVSKPTVLNWIDERGAMFVRSVTDQQKEAMRGLIRQYAYEKYSVDELARVIRPCVGLTDAQSRSVMRYYDTLKENMREQHPRMKASNLRDRCREKTMIYAERMHRRRAYLIAQTEMAYAYNHGMHESMRQAMEQGFMGTMEKRWITSGDLNVCPECDALNGMQIGFDENFDFGKHQILFAGMGLTPPLHPRCGCAVEYIEVSPPVFEPEPEVENEENGDQAVQDTDSLSNAEIGSVAFDNVGSLWQKTSDDEWMNMEVGEIATDADFAAQGGSIPQYTGSLEFTGGNVAQEVMDSKMSEMLKNQYEAEWVANISSDDLREMVESIRLYGVGGECQRILAMQDPDTYKDLLSMAKLSPEEIEKYKAASDNVERFISLSDKVDFPLYRGITFNETMSDPALISRTIADLNEGNIIEIGHVASWSSSRGTAMSYAEGALDAELEGTNYSILYSVDNNKSAVSLSGINPEGECLSPKSATYMIRKVEMKYDEDDDIYRYIVKLEEV